MPDHILIFFVIVAVSACGYMLRFLTASGAAAAIFTGVITALGFGGRGLLLLGVFFLSSSLLTIYKRNQKIFLKDKLEKGSRRDWEQVLANGGTAAAAGVFSFFLKDPVWIPVFSIALASANADTWASEVGVLSKRRPLLIRNLKRTEKGTSGAVSLVGTFAAFSGALLISVFAKFLFGLELAIAGFILILGFAGNLFDTVLGAYLQASFRCTQCRTSTEKPFHCGKPSDLIRGYRIINNEAVNFLSSFGAAAAGAVIIFFLL